MYLLYCWYFLLLHRITDHFLYFLIYFINILKVFSNGLNIRINTLGLKQISSMIISKPFKKQYHLELELQEKNFLVSCSLINLFFHYDKHDNKHKQNHCFIVSSVWSILIDIFYMLFTYETIYFAHLYYQQLNLLA